jgi:cytochrome P450
MFALLFSFGPLYTSAFVLAILTILFLSRRCFVDYQIRRLGGVRAPVLATNPVSGMYEVFIASPDTVANIWDPALPFFIKAGYYQTRDKLEYFYEHIFDWATSECPNCVEVSLLGTVRFLMTREPEHIKTILTTKFGEYGKGERFHEVWKPFLGDSIFTTDGQSWSDSRGLIRPMFIKDRVRDLDIFDRFAGILISKLPASGQTVDVMDLFFRMTLDVTTDFLLGQSVNSLDKWVSQSPWGIRPSS